MRVVFISLIILISYPSSVFSQCNCIDREFEGAKIRQCPPALISGDNMHQIALSIQQVDDIKYLLMTIRFLNKAKTIGSDLMVFTNSKDIFSLRLQKSGKDYVGGSEISNTQFILSPEAMQKLRQLKLTSIRFAFSGEDIDRTFEAKMNPEVMINQLVCF